MGQDAILVCELRTEKDKNSRPYLVVIDGFQNRWNLFGELANTKLEIGKGFLFQYDLNGEYKNVKKIERLDNIFKVAALKELASRTEYVKNFTVSLSYAKDLVIGGKIDLANIYNEAQHIYEWINEKADSEMSKLNPKSEDLK